MASIIIVEQGANGKGGCISGTVKGYRGYFNFFNIGAYRSGGMSAVARGVWYASQSGSYGRPWNTRYKSIKGGAEFYYKEYIKPEQNSLYFKKWNVMNGLSGVGTHQYMSNTQGAALEAGRLAKAYEGTDSSVTFIIPVYNNMPSTACPFPDENSPRTTKADREEQAKLKAADEAKVQAVNDKNAKIKAGVNATTVQLYTRRTRYQGLTAIKLRWEKTGGYRLDYYEVWRSTAKKSGYGKVPYYTTSKGIDQSLYITKNLKKGKTYWFKVRGVRIIKDYYGNKSKVYTKWSNTAGRIIPS